MRSLYSWLLVLLFWVAAAGVARAETFTLVDGTTLSGELGKFSYNNDGLMVKGADGAFSRRVPWEKLSQDSLQKLDQIPDAVPFVDLLVIWTPEQLKLERAAARPEIKITPVERIPRPTPPSKFIALLYSPITILLGLLLYAANIYAAYTVAVFKNHQIWMVCATAAVLPLVGLAVFLAVPGEPIKSTEQRLAEAKAETDAQAATDAQVTEREKMQANLVKLVTAEVTLPETPAAAQGSTYARGQFTFNRRFFETKLAPFLRTVLADAEKAMNIEMATFRGQFAGQKFTKVGNNEIYLHVVKENASQEVMIPFSEIDEIRIRPKANPNASAAKDDAGKVVALVMSGADWSAATLTAAGYRIDFSPASLKELDRFFQEQTQDGVAKPGGLLGDQLGLKLFNLGAYAGEVIRRNAGGEWRFDPEDPARMANIALAFPDNTAVWPVQQAIKRLLDPEAALMAFGEESGLKLG